jgi:hypothetical protein
VMTPLQDQDEEAEIAAAEFAVEDAKAHHAKLHIATAARIARLVFPDAMSIVIDTGLVDGQPDSCQIELVEIVDNHGRPLWTTESPPPATTVPWPDVLNALINHLVASLPDAGVCGWEAAIGR